jgi:hypothetical protein
VQELQVHIFDKIVTTDSPVVLVHTQSVQQDHRCTQAHRLSKLQQDTTAAYSNCHGQPTTVSGCPTAFWYYCILLKGSYYYHRRRRCNINAICPAYRIGLQSPYPLGRWVVNPNQEPGAQAVDMPVAGHQVAVEEPLSMAVTEPATATATTVGCLLRSLLP